MKTGKIVLWIILCLIIMVPSVIFIRGCGMVENMATDGISTVEKQFSPSQLLKKYEWFKNASAQLDGKIATLGIYEERIERIDKAYQHFKQSEWGRADREQHNVWQSEYLGVKASYNQLAAEYNAAMAKFNYVFCNVGTLPEGAIVPLPREYKPYINK